MSQTEPRRWRAAWTPRRIRLWLAVALAAAWLPIVGVPLRDFLDFSAFYVAAQHAFTPDVMRLEPIILAQQAAGLPISPFHYPPGYALLFVPLTWLPFALAGVVNLAIMIGALLLAAISLARLYGLPARLAIIGALAWSPAAESVLSGQNASLALLLIAVVGLLMRADAARTGGTQAAGSGSTKVTRSLRANIAAGLMVAALAYKPQFAAPVAGLALLRGRWAMLVAVVLDLVGQYLVGVVVAGGNWAWPSDWLTGLSGYSDVDLATNGWQAISLPALLARVPLSVLGSTAPAAMQGLSVIGYGLGTLVIVLCIPAMRRLPLPRALALAASLGLLITPHAWVYNATLLLPALAVLWADGARRGWPWQDRWLFALIYAAGALWPLGGIVGFTLLPIVVIAMPWLLLGERPWGQASVSTYPPASVAGAP